MQTVSNGDSLHEMPNPVSGKNKKNIINLSSAELAHKVVKVKGEYLVIILGYFLLFLH